MNRLEQALLSHAFEAIFPLAGKLREDGWQLEVLVLAPDEIPRIEGYKVALVVSVKS